MPSKDHTPDVLTEAHALIRGDRKSHYGPPTENFARIAEMWSAYLGHPVSPVDVCSLMVLLKVARVRSGGGYHRDSFVDIGGYAGLAEVVHEGGFPEDHDA